MCNSAWLWHQLIPLLVQLKVPMTSCFAKAAFSCLKKTRQLAPTIDLDPFGAFEGMRMGM